MQDALGNTIEDTLKGDFNSIGKLWSDLLIKMVSQAIAADIGKALFGDLGNDWLVGGTGRGDGCGPQWLTMSEHQLKTAKARSARSRRRSATT